MIKYPKARKVGFALAFFSMLVMLSGCCTCRDRYAPFFTQIEDNLRNDIRPKYRDALEAQGLPSDVVDNRVGLVTDTANSCERVRTGGIEAWKPEGSEPGAGGDE